MILWDRFTYVSIGKSKSYPDFHKCGSKSFRSLVQSIFGDGKANHSARFNQMMTISVKINIRTSSIDVHKDYSHRCANRAAVDKFSAVSHSAMVERVPWASCNHMFSVLVHTRTEIELTNFLKCAEGVMV